MPSPHPDPRPSSERPTPKQLRYLRALALERGQTFKAPATKKQASAQIRRLLRAPAEDPIEREGQRERDQREPVDGASATAVRDDEVTGYGANCQWSHSTRGPKSA